MPDTLYEVLNMTEDEQKNTLLKGFLNKCKPKHRQMFAACYLCPIFYKDLPGAEPCKDFPDFWWLEIYAPDWLYQIMQHEEEEIKKFAREVGFGATSLIDANDYLKSIKDLNKLHRLKLDLQMLLSQGGATC